MNIVFMGVWGLSQQASKKLPTLVNVYGIVKIWHVYCQ